MNFSLNRRPRRPTPVTDVLATDVLATVANTSSTSVVTGRSSSPEHDWDNVDLSSTEYARRRRELMQLINELRSMGAQTLIDLPSIVVIGGQSAGKSSLVEAVSGINVPRDSGTCTRCPMECTLSSSTTWSCKIELRFDYDSDGTAANNSRKENFGPTITDRDEVDVWLRRAQAAILNPDLPLTSFHGKSVQEIKNFTSPNSLKFSQNAVCVFIEDPSATDLSFVDLPGLIQNEDRDVVDLIRRLTESYISRPNTIILTTIPMSDDMENQQSVTLAKRVDPEGERTIGILTKPDTLGDGAINARRQWRDIIEGRRHKLKHGYYCVRLPDDAQRAQHMSRAALQRLAATYFDSTPPWSEIADRRRFGVPSFVSDISVLLVNHINRVLPQLKQDVERLLASCLDDLRTLPPPLEVDPQIEVLARVSAFCDAFKGIVTGISSDKELAQRNRALYKTFAQNIRGTFPDFRPFDQPTQQARMDAFDSEEAAAVPNEEVQTMGVYEVRKVIKESIAWELPGNIPYEAKTRLIRQFTVLWVPPAEECLSSINDVLDDIIQKLVKTHFGRFKVLLDFISDLIRSDVEERKRGALTAIKETLKLEASPNYTQNENDFHSLRDKWLAKYRYARQNAPGGYNYDHNSASQALQHLTRAGYKNLTIDDLARLSPRDQQFDDELVVMADVRAYFTVACKRIVDHIPLKIEHTLHHALAARLSVNLLQRLLVDTTSAGNFADRMKELVRDDPETENKRTRLEATRIRLKEMNRILVNFAA